jgi:arylsulfatase A-like enzyme
MTGLTLAGLWGCGDNATRKPNIIYILADDLGYGDLGCYGQKRIQTPNIDRLAEEGLRFTHHYAGSTICAPSRCCLLTGMHTGHARIRGNTPVLLKPEDTTVAEVLRQQGYHTACIGKWGVGHPPPPGDPEQNGFDYFFGYLNMMHAHNYYPEVLYRNGKEVELDNEVPDHWPDNGSGVASSKRDYSHDLFVEDALKYIDSHQTDPFFLYLAFTIPHANNEAREKGMEVPDYGPYAETDWPEPQKGHAAMITRMDAGVGEIMKKLAALNLDDDTIIMFSSDNGPHREGGNNPDFNDSNGPLKGIKRDLYEGGIRVPMIARWPGVIASGTETSHPSAFWDVMPTLADLTGGTVPAHIDGVSFAPTLRGRPDEQEKHEYLYWEFHEQGFQQAARMDQWKGVRPGPDAELEVYDILKDPGETRNLADQVPAVVRKIKKLFETARSDSPHYPVS